MSHKSDLIENDIESYLKQHENKSLLRFITCGSVDDGKSTLIGRLLHDSKLIYEDQLAAIKNDSKKKSDEDEIDLALLVDGLQSEREQGITIDVAYRYFSTEKRKYIIADTPGHEQYTRNMATGASTADLAVILIDARKGVQTQTRRHSFICSLLGIRRLVVAINKMDLVSFEQEVFEKIQEDYLKFISQLGNIFQGKIDFIPMSALKGDNVVTLSSAMNWYQAHPLMEYLDTVEVPQVSSSDQFRFPVQYVNRPHLNFRGYAGTIASGMIKKNQKIKILPSGFESKVKEIITWDAELEEAFAGDAITLTLEDEIDISRGDMIVACENRVDVGTVFDARIVWMNERPLALGESYDFKFGPTTITGKCTEIHYEVDVNTLEKNLSSSLSLNSIGICRFELTHPVCLDSYLDFKTTGGFIIIDRFYNTTLAAGMIIEKVNKEVFQKLDHDSLSEVVWNHTTITPKLRSIQKKQRPRCIWFTGLSGSGKSTLANALEQELYKQGFHTMLLDGDNLRHGLCKDLTMSEVDRGENIRRVAEVAKLMSDAGLIVITAFISPFKKQRNYARSLFPDGDFIEVFVDTPLDVCEARDVKGLYKKARAGEIPDFTGVSSPFEAPTSAELVFSVENHRLEQLVAKIIKKIK